MTKVIAIANQKGGVGKTSTTVNLGAGLVRQGYDVLLIDLDSQANLTMALGYQNPDDMEFTISNVLHKAVQEEQIDPAEGILTTAEGIDLMPANVQLSGLEISLINEYGRENMLKQYIDEVRLNYDYILIDCAPSLSVLTVNALVAADSVLIPTQPHYFSMAGLQITDLTGGLDPVLGRVQVLPLSVGVILQVVKSGVRLGFDFDGSLGIAGISECRRGHQCEEHEGTEQHGNEFLCCFHRIPFLREIVFSVIDR